jgi:nucleoside-diphosphate-sugar epimerase
MKLLVTGGAGFIGSNFIRHILETYADYRIVNLDALTYAGNLDNLQDIAEMEGGGPQARYQFIKGDIGDAALVNRIAASGIDAIVNFAAESHVDRSIDNAGVFISTNVLGTQVLLDAALRYTVGRFIQISTILKHSNCRHSSPGAPIITAPISFPKNLFPCLSPTRWETSCCRCMAMALMCATGFMLQITARRLTECFIMAGLGRYIILAATVRKPIAKLLIRY